MKPLTKKELAYAAKEWNKGLAKSNLYKEFRVKNITPSDIPGQYELHLVDLNKNPINETHFSDEDTVRLMAKDLKGFNKNDRR